jgi:hypothetical protein
VRSVRTRFGKIVQIGRERGDNPGSIGVSESPNNAIVSLMWRNLKTDA